MAINFKDIKQNFFINYYKYWIAFFVILLVYIINNNIKYNSSVSEITMSIDKAVYVTNAVAINKKCAIANKSIIDEACVGKYSGYKGKFYFVTKESIYPASIENGDTISNMVILKMSKVYDNFSSYAILQKDRTEYANNKRLIIPKTTNKAGTFNFKKTRVVSNNNNVNFFTSNKIIDKKNKILGMPIFNKNFVLQGVVKEQNSNYENKTYKDKILNDSNIQKTYFVNDVNTIKKFLNRYNIEYSIVDSTFNLDNTTYNAKDSIVNVICISTL